MTTSDLPSAKRAIGYSATMPQQSRTWTTDIAYYSAHRGSVFGSDGKFHHFARQCDPVHMRNGYWRFSTYDDDRCAYQHGLNTPEAVLIAQDVGDGAYNDIMLRWVPGELDTSNKPSVGTAAAHLETIYNERRLLGKSLSFRGRVPLYPISTDQKLINYRLTRYGTQKGVLPGTALMSASRHSSPNDRVSTTSVPVESPERSLSRASVSVSTPVRTLSSPQAESTAVPSNKSAPKPVVTLCNDTSIRSSLLAPLREPVSWKNDLGSTGDLQVSLPTQHYHRKASSPDRTLCERVPSSKANPSTITHTSGPLPTTISSGLEEHDLADDQDNACYMHGSDGIADSSSDDISILSFANLAPSELFDAQSAALPCMDCGSIGSHASHCWIKKATLSLQPTLTTSELRELADHVNRFDPGPRTAHTGPPRESVEDPKTQVQNMAEIIRGLDASAGDPELHVFDDQLTIFLWAVKSSGKVQILKR